MGAIQRLESRYPGFKDLIHAKKRGAVTPEESLADLENEINSWLLGYEPIMTRSNQFDRMDGSDDQSEARKKRIYSRVLDIPDQNFLTL